MNIVITDGYTLNPGDLSWDGIQKLGDVSVYDRTPTEQIVSRCSQAEVVLSNKTPFSRRTIEHLPRLKMIAVTATGYNIIDVSAASEKSIIVCNVPAYGTMSVAQHTFALLLLLSNHTHLNVASVEQGNWQRSSDWCYTTKPITELAGKTLGIVGLGNIGMQTAKIALAFGMTVIYNSRHDKQIELARYTDLQSLFNESDYISLHCPLTQQNERFVNRELLRLMKPSAYIINTARGQLINEPDLADSLNNNRIAGAALDVLSKEPPDDSNPLLAAKNCIITPHNAWMAKEARQRIMQVTTENVHSFSIGNPQNVVNK